MRKSRLLKRVCVFFLPVPAGNLTLFPRISGHRAQTPNNQADFQLWLSAEWNQPRVFLSLSIVLPWSHTLLPHLFQSLSTWKENLLLAQFKLNLPFYRWILTFNILALCWQVYIQLSSSNMYRYHPVALNPHYENVCVSLFLKSELLSDEELEYQLWPDAVYKSCSCNLNILPNSVHMHYNSWHHSSRIANIQQHSDSIKPQNVLVCLQQNPANFIKARAAKCVTADLIVLRASLLSRVLSSSWFSRAEKPRSPVCIPFQLNQHHLIPITLIIAARDVSEWGENKAEWCMIQEHASLLQESKNSSVARQP